MRLLDSRLAVPEQGRLRIMIGKALRLAAHLVAVQRLWKRAETSRAGLKGATASERIRFVGDASPIDRLAMHAVALVVVRWRHRCIDRNLVKVGSAEARYLRVYVRVNASSEQRIVGEVQSRHDVCRAERYLLGFSEEIVWVTVKSHFTDGNDGHEFLGNDFGRV